MGRQMSKISEGGKPWVKTSLPHVYIQPLEKLQRIRTVLIRNNSSQTQIYATKAKVDRIQQVEILFDSFLGYKFK